MLLAAASAFTGECSESSASGGALLALWRWFGGVLAFLAAMEKEGTG